jgi:hypothetical protein
MSRHQRIRHARESSLLQVNIRAANFRNLDREQSGVAFQLRLGNFAHLDARVWFGNYSDK